MPGCLEGRLLHVCGAAYVLVRPATVVSRELVIWNEKVGGDGLGCACSASSFDRVTTTFKIVLALPVGVVGCFLLFFVYVFCF